MMEVMISRTGADRVEAVPFLILLGATCDAANDHDSAAKHSRMSRRDAAVELIAVPTNSLETSERISK